MNKSRRTNSSSYVCVPIWRKKLKWLIWLSMVSSTLAWYVCPENNLFSSGCSQVPFSCFCVAGGLALLQKPHYLLSLWKVWPCFSHLVFLTIFSTSVLSPKIELIFKVITTTPSLLNTAFPGAMTTEWHSFLGVPEAHGQLPGQTYICILNSLLCQSRELLLHPPRSAGANVP